MVDLDDKATEWRTASRRTRTSVLVLGLLALGLVAGPLAMGMLTKAPQGASMLEDFTPFMSSERLAGFIADLDLIDDAVSELDATDARATNPTYAEFSEQWPPIEDDMSGLMGDVTDNLDNYQAMADLPSFRLFPWFFLAPGLVLLAVLAVVALRRRWTRGSQVAVAAVGIALVVVPFAFGMFARAPKGGEMMSAFADLETSENVGRIQGYFSQMAVGQGSIRLEVVPALQETGLSAAEVARQFPATTALNDGWVHILNDMTPMIGAMSDNVDNYDALKSLPPFAIFPWAFLVPGLIVVGLALLAGRPVRLTHPQGEPA
ncbi:4-amino-4-deoxy-L-arabinose transferase-like glycosyltransferase [Marmoricola sp. OAE513]|uniref:hypothetical protein n=1 Tax=Marmoricola sp. OAE513 TaxID=2817894 RepID=UPI001AE7E92A